MQVFHNNSSEIFKRMFPHPRNLGQDGFYINKNGEKCCIFNIPKDGFLGHDLPPSSARRCNVGCAMHTTPFVSFPILFALETIVAHTPLSVVPASPPYPLVHIYSRVPILDYTYQNIPHIPVLFDMSSWVSLKPPEDPTIAAALDKVDTIDADNAFVIMLQLTTVHRERVYHSTIAPTPILDALCGRTTSKSAYRWLDVLTIPNNWMELANLLISSLYDSITKPPHNNPLVSGHIANAPPCDRYGTIARIAATKLLAKITALKKRRIIHWVNKNQIKNQHKKVNHRNLTDSMLMFELTHYVQIMNVWNTLDCIPESVLSKEEGRTIIEFIRDDILDVIHRKEGAMIRNTDIWAEMWYCALYLDRTFELHYFDNHNDDHVIDTHPLYQNPLLIFETLVMSEYNNVSDVYRVNYTKMHTYIVLRLLYHEWEKKKKKNI